MIGRSFKEHGAGRSVFIDKNNRLVGGNKAQIGFKGAGYRKVVIVDSDPDTLVAVRRKDVDLDTKEGREMALLDNLTTERNLQWDEKELEQIDATVDGFDTTEWGFELPGEEQPKKEPKEETLRPFNTNHVLISYPIDLHDKIMQLIEELREEPRIEIESSAN